MAPSIAPDANSAPHQPPSFCVPPATDIVFGTNLFEAQWRPERPDTKGAMNRGHVMPGIEEKLAGERSRRALVHLRNEAP